MGTTPELYSLSWGNFSTSLSSTVQSLRGLGDLVDVTLTAGGKIFPAHKLVLCSASPLLMELLKSTKCEHPVVMLAGINAADLEALLHFVYTGEVSVDPAQVPSLLQAAQCLDIQPFSPSLLSVHLTQKTVEDVPNPVLGETKRPPLSPFGSVRKKRKKARPYSGEAEGDDSSKDSSLLKKPTLVSDLPVSCSICGVTLRQSRNLRRHMALIHMKYTSTPGVGKNNPNPDSPKVSNSRGLASENPEESNCIRNSIGDQSRIHPKGRLGELRIDGSHPTDSSFTDDTSVVDMRFAVETVLETKDPQADGHMIPMYPTRSLTEPLHAYLNLEPSYTSRHTDLFRHQQT